MLFNVVGVSRYVIVAVSFSHVGVDIVFGVKRDASALWTSWIRAHKERLQEVQDHLVAFLRAHRGCTTRTSAWTSVREILLNQAAYYMLQVDLKSCFSILDPAVRKTKDPSSHPGLQRVALHLYVVHESSVSGGPTLTFVEVVCAIVVPTGD